MPCEVVKSGGGVAIVCSRGRRVRARCGCNRVADKLCDWKLGGVEGKTCDAPLCARCTFEPAPEKDLCPKHAAIWKARSA